MNQGYVAVIAGGSSAERAVSLRSGEAIYRALQEQGIPALWYDPQEQSLVDLPAQGVAHAFLALHGRGGEDGRIQALLEELRVPYTGSGVLACALTIDKSRTKALWQGFGLPTAASCTLRQAESGELLELPTSQPVNAAAVLDRLGGQVMVKPSQEGSSLGMSLADTAAELTAAVRTAAYYDQQVLVEQLLSGPEYTVAMLDGEPLPAIRVETPRRFYDYAAKYEQDTTEYWCPAGLSEAAEQQVRQLARQAFAAVDGYGWGRVDLMQDSAGQFQLLEVNTIPGMTEKSLVPMAAQQAGLSFGQLVTRILAGATVRRP